MFGNSRPFPWADIVAAYRACPSLGRVSYFPTPMGYVIFGYSPSRDSSSVYSMWYSCCNFRVRVSKDSKPHCGMIYASGARSCLHEGRQTPCDRIFAWWFFAPVVPKWKFPHSAGVLLVLSGCWSFLHMWGICDCGFLQQCVPQSNMFWRKVLTWLVLCISGKESGLVVAARLVAQCLWWVWLLLFRFRS